MEVWLFAIIMGMWFCALFIIIGFLIGRGIHDKKNNDVADKGMDEREPILDSSDLSDVQRGCGDRSGNQSVLERMDADAAKETLETMRMAAKYSDTERDAIDYSVECIDIAHKLAKYFKGETE